MADILATSYTQEQNRPLTRGVPFFNESTGEYLRDSTLSYYDRLGVEIVEGNVGDATLSQSQSVSAQETTVRGIVLNPLGTKLFITGTTHVYEYNLLTAFDVSTLTFVQSYNAVAQETVSVRGIAFNNDGTKMYITGTNSNDVHEYNLASAYSLTTPTFVQSFDVSAQNTFHGGLTFNNDGSKMYLAGAAPSEINEYDLSTPFNISTAVFLQVFSPIADIGNAESVKFNSDGSIMYVAGINSPQKTNSLVSYKLSTPFDVSTSTLFDGISLENQETNVTGIFINSVFEKMYMVGADSESIHEYNVSIKANTRLVSGAFVPEIKFGGASTGITYVINDGQYAKVGNLVFFNIHIVLSSKGSSTGTARIINLPFSISNDISLTATEASFRATNYLNIIDFSADLDSAEQNISLQAVSGGGPLHYDIGPWNMDLSGVPDNQIVHNLNFADIGPVSAIIVNDAGTLKLPLDFSDTTLSGDAANVNGNIQVNATNFIIGRRSGGFFDSTDYNDGVMNRGTLTVQYNKSGSLTDEDFQNTSEFTITGFYFTDD